MEFINSNSSGSDDPITDVASLKSLRASGAKIVLFFWAQWHEPSKEGGALQEAFSLLSKKYTSKGLKFFRVEAEAVPDVSEAFEVSVVPTYITLNGMTEGGKLEGVNPTEVVKLVKTLADSPVQEPVDLEALLTTRLESLINTAPVMLFMKGNPEGPKCKFSRQVVELLANEKIPYHSFDILTDDDVRSGLKKYSDWPTFPQIYVNGALCGGLDILKEMKEEGPLREQLGIENLVPEPAEEVSIEERLVKLTTQAPIMLFMKGDPSEPKCGFSRTIVGLLNEESIEFSSFDILSDEDVRAGLKTFSDRPTYPQLYVKGEFIGGLDIIQEMKEEGSLKDQLEQMLAEAA